MLEAKCNLPELSPPNAQMPPNNLSGHYNKPDLRADASLPSINAVGMQECY
jgi:hypothetical protein